jgi:cysteine desulfuration protein SufE
MACPDTFASYHAANPYGTEVTVDSLIDDFSLIDDWESRYRYLIELGHRLPPLPDVLRTEANLIHGCQSQAWIRAERTNGKLRFMLDSDAHIVRGLIAILLAAVNDKTPEEIRAVDFEALFAKLDLLRHLSPGRGNGLRSMVARIKAVAA